MTTGSPSCSQVAYTSIRRGSSMSTFCVSGCSLTPRRPSSTARCSSVAGSSKSCCMAAKPMNSGCAWHCFAMKSLMAVTACAVVATECTMKCVMGARSFAVSRPSAVPSPNMPTL